MKAFKGVPLPIDDKNSVGFFLDVYEFNKSTVNIVIYLIKLSLIWMSGNSKMYSGFGLCLQEDYSISSCGPFTFSYYN